MADVAKELEDLLKNVVKETGASLSLSAKDLAAAIQASAKRLQAAIGEPGYALALIAERDVIALKAGLNATVQADAVDNRIIGLVTGALGILAAAL